MSLEVAPYRGQMSGHARAPWGSTAAALHGGAQLVFLLRNAPIGLKFTSVWQVQVFPMRLNDRGGPKASRRSTKNTDQSRAVLDP